MMMNEPEVTIEVVGKRGKCIRCSKPGRKRKVVAKCGRHSARETEILCIPCANNMGVSMKWAVKYGNRPVCCQGMVELGLVSGDSRNGGQVRH